MYRDLKEFNSLEEIQPYYKAKTNTYEFSEHGRLFSVEFNFSIHVNSNIIAIEIYAKDIHARNIETGDIKANDINVCNLNAYDIDAHDINAFSICAKEINYHAVCFAYKNIKCSRIQGQLINSKHFCIDGEIKEG